MKSKAFIKSMTCKQLESLANRNSKDKMNTKTYLSKKIKKWRFATKSIIKQW